MRNLLNIVLYDWIIATSPEQTIPSFSNGKHVGSITTAAGNFEVWQYSEDNILELGAIDPKIGPNDPIAFVYFQEMSQGSYISRRAATKKEYTRKGVMSELFKYMTQVLRHSFLSDTHMSYDGIDLWNSLIKSGKFNTKILYAPSGELFELSDIGKKTKDGCIIINPEMDSFYDNFYDPDTEEGQRFFYAMLSEGKIYTKKITETVGFGVPVGVVNGIRVQRYQHFSLGDY